MRKACTSATLPCVESRRPFARRGSAQTLSQAHVAVDFSSLRRVQERAKGLIITLAVNWLIKPFTMAALGVLFLEYVFAPFIDPADTGTQRWRIVTEPPWLTSPKPPSWRST